MADNVLGVLFKDIADAIRAKTGGTDTMKPNEFPAEIAAILVGSGSDEWLYASGSFTADNKAHIISHGLGVTPDIAILRCPVSLSPEISTGLNFLWSVGISEEFGNDVKVKKGSAFKSMHMTLDWSSGGNITNVSGQYINKSGDTFNAISNASSGSIRFGYAGYTLGTREGDCYWYTFARKKASGGSSADVRYVTFIGADGSVLYKKAVAVGDDCVDVVAKGIIGTPTKEMTVAEVYTYSGWSLTAGGSVSASALKNVTEDRTVYAAFTSSARVYTVRFYDGTTLLQTSQVAYGSPAIPPDVTKTGYEFVAWTPSDLTVYGDTDFVGEWKKISSFERVKTFSFGDSDSDNVNSGLALSNDARYIAATTMSTKQTHPVLYDLSGDTPVSIGDGITHANITMREVSFSENDYYLFVRGYDSETVGTYKYLIMTSRKSNDVYTFESRSNSSSNIISIIGVGNNQHVSLTSKYNSSEKKTIYYLNITALGVSGGEKLTLPFGVYANCFAGDRSKIVLIDSDDKTKVYIYSIDETSFTLYKEITLDSAPPISTFSIAVNRDATRLVVYDSTTAGDDGAALYSLNTGALIKDMREDFAGSKICCNIVGNYLICGQGSEVRIFEISGEAPVEIEDLPTYGGTGFTRIVGNYAQDHIAIQAGKYVEIWQIV